MPGILFGRAIGCVTGTYALGKWMRDSEWLTARTTCAPPPICWVHAHCSLWYPMGPKVASAPESGAESALRRHPVTGFGGRNYSLTVEINPANPSFILQT